VLTEGVDKDLERIRRRKLKDVLRKPDKVGGEKTSRVVIPVMDHRGVDSQLSGHFGRAPFFAVFELSDDGRILDQKMVPNESEHFGGIGSPPDRILQLDPDAVITYGMGPRALSRFQYARVAVLRANKSTVRDVLSAYTRDELEELTEGCHHARHPS
jgi:predicted Fe-Mo cluster-binding NifX family protein